MIVRQARGAISVVVFAVLVALASRATAGPVVTSIEPDTGTPRGGMLVIIEGSGFEPGATLHFDGARATSVVVESPTVISAMTPSHAPGDAEVIVTNADSSVGVLASTYTFHDAQILPRRGVQRVFADIAFDAPVLLTHAGEGSGRVFVVELAGRIVAVGMGGAATVFLDITERVDDSKSQSGLLSLAFHPHYADDGRFFVFYSTAQTRSRLSEFRVSSDDPGVADATSERVLLEVEQTGFHHNGDHLAFGPDGMLYISQGGGGQSEAFATGQDRGSLKGAILRIDVDGQTVDGQTDRQAAPYAIPPDNPFVGNDSGWREEIWAWGMRQPWRFSFDRKTGQLWAGDVGWGLWEEINLVVKGGNYGWSTMEGAQCASPLRHTGAAGCDRTGLRLPAFAYGHGDGRGASVTGGYVYRGQRLTGLIGTYVYADFSSNTVSALRLDGDSVLSSDVIASVPMPASFGEDEKGELYVVSFGQGRIYALQQLPEESQTDP